MGPASGTTRSFGPDRSRRKGACWPERLAESPSDRGCSDRCLDCSTGGTESVRWCQAAGHVGDAGRGPRPRSAPRPPRSSRAVFAHVDRLEPELRARETAVRTRTPTAIAAGADRRVEQHRRRRPASSVAAIRADAAAARRDELEHDAHELERREPRMPRELRRASPRGDPATRRADALRGVRAFAVDVGRVPRRPGEADDGRRMGRRKRARAVARASSPRRRRRSRSRRRLPSKPQGRGWRRPRTRVASPGRHVGSRHAAGDLGRCALGHCASSPAGSRPRRRGGPDVRRRSSRSRTSKSCSPPATTTERLRSTWAGSRPRDASRRESTSAHRAAATRSAGRGGATPERTIRPGCSSACASNGPAVWPRSSPPTAWGLGAAALVAARRSPNRIDRSTAEIARRIPALGQRIDRRGDAPGAGLRAAATRRDGSSKASSARRRLARRGALVAAGRPRRRTSPARGAARARRRGRRARGADGRRVADRGRARHRESRRAGPGGARCRRVNVSDAFACSGSRWSRPPTTLPRGPGRGRRRGNRRAGSRCRLAHARPARRRRRSVARAAARRETWSRPCRSTRPTSTRSRSGDEISLLAGEAELERRGRGGGAARSRRGVARLGSARGGSRSCARASSRSAVRSSSCPTPIGVEPPTLLAPRGAAARVPPADRHLRHRPLRRPRPDAVRGDRVRGDVRDDVRRRRSRPDPDRARPAGPTGPRRPRSVPPRLGARGRRRRRRDWLRRRVRRDVRPDARAARRCGSCRSTTRCGSWSRASLVGTVLLAVSQVIGSVNRWREGGPRGRAVRTVGHRRAVLVRRPRARSAPACTSTSALLTIAGVVARDRPASRSPSPAVSSRPAAAAAASRRRRSNRSTASCGSARTSSRSRGSPRSGSRTPRSARSCGTEPRRSGTRTSAPSPRSCCSSSATSPRSRSRHWSSGVQALRLEYYELFSHMFVEEGRPFDPWHIAVVGDERRRRRPHGYLVDRPSRRAGRVRGDRRASGATGQRGLRRLRVVERGAPPRGLVAAR